MELLKVLNKIIHRDNYKNLPLLGINGSGKTYFLVTLGYFVSEKRWGEVSAETSEYFHGCLEYVLKGHSIPYSQSNNPISIKIAKIDSCADEKQCKFIMSSQDFSGRKFLNAMTSSPIENDVVSEKSGDDARNKFFTSPSFHKLYSNSDGIMVMVDLVRDPMTAEMFQKNKDELILKAFSEQITPLIKGIEFILRENINMKGKPILFIFSKADIHKLSLNEISSYFNKIMAIILARLESRGVLINKYVISSIGWGTGDAALNRIEILESKGYIDLLHDITEVFNGR